MEENKKSESKDFDISAYTSSLVARAALYNLLGKSHNGSRDLYDVFGYKQNLSYDDFITQYRRQDIAKAIIKRPVNATWAGELHVRESETNDDTQLEKAFDELQKKINLKGKFARLDRLTSLGEYGVLVLGLSDCTSPSDFAKPVKASSSLELNYVKPVGQGSTTIDVWERNTSSPRFGLPLYYSVTLKNRGSDASTLHSIKVHHTRIIHVCWDLLEDETHGTPVLESVFNRLDDLEKLTGGSAEMFWRGARPGFQGIVDSDYTLPPGIKDSIQNNMDEYEQGLRRLFIQQGMELKSLAPQVENPEAHVKVQIQMISADTGIPQRILNGSEEGKLASGEDADAWKSLIQNRRTEQVEPAIVRPFVDRMIEYGIFPKPQTGVYSIWWSDVFAPSEKEKAETGKTRAIALSEYAKAPLAAEIMPPEIFAELFLGLSKDQIKLIEVMKREGVADEALLQKIVEQQQPKNE